MAVIHRQYPRAYADMQMSSNQVRSFLRDNGIARPPGTTLSDYPVLSIGRPEFIEPIKNFGIKLFCALHYKHAGQVVPEKWKIAMRMMTNVNLEEGIISSEIFQVLNGRPVLQRSKTDLEDQFSYIYAVATEGTVSAYLCKFRESFALLGLVSADPLPKDFDEVPEMGAFQGSPYRWN